MISPFTFVRQIRSELKKVVWPNRAQTIQLSVVTIVFITIMGLFFLIADNIFGKLVQLFFSFTIGK